MFTKAEAITGVITAANAAGLIVSSSASTDPPPIRPGDPFHAAVHRLERQFPNEMLPAKGRSRWKRFLRFSRCRDPQLYEAVDDFLDWLDEIAESEQATSSDDDLPDGPCEHGFKLRWQGSVFDLKPQVWRVIEFFWNRTIAMQGDFEDAIWGECTDAVAVRKAIHRANQAINRAGVPWRLRLKNAHVVKEPISTTCDQFVTVGSR